MCRGDCVRSDQIAMMDHGGNDSSEESEAVRTTAAVADCSGNVVSCGSGATVAFAGLVVGDYQWADQAKETMEG